MQTETSITNGIAAVIRKIIRNTNKDGLSVQVALKRTMSKLLGEFMISKQETCYLTLSLPIVQCSHQFTRIDLDNNFNLVDMGENENINNNADAENTINEIKSSTKKSIIKINVTDSHAKRLEPFMRASKNLYEECFPNLNDANLIEFAKIFRVGLRGLNKNEICEHNKKNIVTAFFPKINSNKNVPDYHECCKFNILKHTP